jgi:hypothetical protein
MAGVVRDDLLDVLGIGLAPEASIQQDFTLSWVAGLGQSIHGETRLERYIEVGWEKSHC